MVAEGCLELPQVLHRVRSLPLGGLPLLGRDVPIAREPGPIRLLVRALERIGEGLGGRVGVRIPVASIGPTRARCFDKLRAVLRRKGIR